MKDNKVDPDADDGPEHFFTARNFGVMSMVLNPLDTITEQHRPSSAL